MRSHVRAQINESFKYVCTYIIGMTYIEKIERGGKNYYYLTKNIRVGFNKWKKIRQYIGNRKPTKEEIRIYTKVIEMKVKNGGFVKRKYLYLTDNNAEILEDLKESYKEWQRKLPTTARKKLEEEFVIRFTYNSNAIEGNRLTLRQTALILKDKIIPSGARAEDYNEAINGRECLGYLKNYKGDFNEKQILKVNELLTKNTGVVYGGRIRFFNVRIDGSEHVPPAFQELKRHLSNLFKWYSANKNKLHPFELATIVHAKLTRIQPFEDGNGRTARAIMNFILMKKSFPMFFIPFERRERYYESLELADKRDYSEYISVLLELIVDQINSYGHKKRR